MCIDWVSQVAGIKLQDVCQYEDKKKKLNIDIFSTLEMRINHKV
jgi:hypothetical protein